MNFLSHTKAVAVSTALIGVGLLSSAPAIADNHVNVQPMGETMNEPMSEPMGSEAMSEPMSEPMSSDMPTNETIVGVASSTDSFSTLVQAVQAADLASTLSEPGPYTVFAPTDEAFAQLPDGALEFLLEPENKDLLAQVLKYHVVPGEVMASELSTGGINALGGGLAVGAYDTGVVINNASVTQADIQASNGVIHQVNRVLVPTALQQALATRLGVSSLY